MNQWFAGAVPHNSALGLRLIRLEEDGPVAELPYDSRLVGDPTTGTLHGGVVTSMIDATCGIAVVVALRQPTRVATIDLRIDYLQAATPGQPLLCKASCYRVTRYVAFVRALAYHGDETAAVAAAAGTFAIAGRVAPPGTLESQRDDR
jgi:uncharacterized protein (TIGR00369 family)